MRVCTVEEMRELDRRAWEEYGLPDAILMENAGQAVYQVLRSQYGMDGRRYSVICGRGNNGGDGFVVARLLHSNGADVRVFLFTPEEGLKGAAKANLDAARRAGIPLQRLQSVDDLYLGRQCDVVVDAIFGTGITRDVIGLEAEVLQRINDSGLPVVSIDIPSGVDGNTGQVHGAAVRAACTVTFGLPKLGNVLPPGRELCGRLFVSHISFPPALHGGEGRVMLNRVTVLPRRALESHKGSYGSLLLVAGAASYLGAPVLCAMAFLKTGGGYVRLAAPCSVAPFLASSATEAVLVPLAETDEGSAAFSNLPMLLESAGNCDVVAIGPGLSLNPETQELVRAVVSATDRPVLVDGDGLTAIAAEAGCVGRRNAPTLLTPHAGEMARLLGCPVAEVLGNRVGAVREAARQFNATVLLKGSSTLVSTPEGVVSVNLSGNPGMASAGCGDVLAGTIAALAGLGFGLREAAETGAFIHGLAGDLAAGSIGEDGVTARDVLERIPQAVRTYRESFDDIRRNFYGRVVVI
jgi:hydroxyethylthiazole kinase-like uncharacterized protein yjeF